MGKYDEIKQRFAGGALFTAFDLETTGLDPQKDKIVEIGAVKFDRLGITARFSALVNPGIPIAPEASKVNHITDAMLIGEPAIEETLPGFIRFIGDSMLIAHNATFDCGFINAELKRLCGGQGLLAETPWVPPYQRLPESRVIDTLTMSRDLDPSRQTHKLQDLAAGYNIPSAAAHRAEDDARVCMEIFIRLLGV
ncbi:MAG: 3'-5' exonuclease [Treponema sp.]|jgi:DNA polymerase-3 subunit epsilon|nr:3'-5' exonuclease [Treponema sp.]